MMIYGHQVKHKNIQNVDEMNISRSHWDSEINNRVYQSKVQNSLDDTLKYFRPMVKELRLCTVKMKGIMETESEYLQMIDRYENIVDKFVLRPLIPEKKGIEEFIVDFDVSHQKLKKDEIECHCHKNLVIGPDGNIYEDFNFNERFKEI